MDKSKLLSGSCLFCELTADELTGLAHHAELREVRAKQVVIAQGTEGEEMYAVLRGRLKVSRTSSEGKEATLAILEGGEVFGEIAMLDGGARTASVEALEPCELLVLKRDVVLSYLETHPKVMRQLIAALCQRLRGADELLQDTLFLPMTQRLAKVLRQLGAQHGSSGPRGTLIDLKLSQQEIANLVGASRESVNKQLNAWENEGLIELVSSGYIRLLKPEQLPV
ncbi:cAMP-binding domain of CRP or a regulatory subunit of cAMP-dependent protein kinases [Andreprevotia lacus DSM 23236]|jgi:CRP-like cAMP-binding protein|uniref:cAMP-binding domain of CRP or a regulatory subunit of cAMP-dependent protein kinases n=1 Tax=Andreprevotia lacus DSM 23236 TaxID=1121001 RepID=A0A1W1WWM3_9NEIS|nr:Crp/Fnr family transcriptional regulator [Andreprevotia lacus]SMC16055.1 cAMP-binding domain of CRP or a regulatory subunit of cAMP-dependent protein kinases [Andreprevotia lacus DSM 23236]